MSSFSERLKTSFGKGNTKVTRDNTSEPKLTIQHRSTRLNTKIKSGTMASDTFDNIVRNAATAQNVSIANIPIYHNTPDVEEVLPFTKIYDPTRAAQHIQHSNTQTVVAQVHQLVVQTTTQNHQNRLYPDLQTLDSQGVMQSNSGQSVRHMLYGDTTNPNADLLDPPLQEDEQLVVNVATQQNGVPTSHSHSTLQPCRSTTHATNLPADYDLVTPLQEPQQQTQPKQAATQPAQENKTPQTTAQSQPQPSTSTSNVTGENLSLQIQDGPYGPLLRYGHSDCTLYYLVACTLESFLDSGTISDISNVLYQQELDRFIQDSHFADLTRFPLLRQIIAFLFEAYYDHETEVTFKTDNPDQNYSDEDLDDMLPYDPPPPILEGGTTQDFGDTIPQVDGASDYGEDFMSVPGSPAIWQSYALNKWENQFVNWDHLAERLMRADRTIIHKVENDCMKNEQDNYDQEQSVYSEIDEVADRNIRESHDNKNKPDHDHTDMFDPYQHEHSYMGASNSFFSRHSQRAPGQPPAWGYHQLNYHMDPNATNAQLYAPN